MAPEIASKKVTIEISKILKFIDVAYTASKEKTAECETPHNKALTTPKGEAL